VKLSRLERFVAVQNRDLTAPLRWRLASRTWPPQKMLPIRQRARLPGCIVGDTGAVAGPRSHPVTPWRLPVAVWGPGVLTAASEQQTTVTDAAGGDIAAAAAAEDKKERFCRSRPGLPAGTSGGLSYGALFATRTAPTVSAWICRRELLRGGRSNPGADFAGRAGQCRAEPPRRRVRSARPDLAHLPTAESRHTETRHLLVRRGSLVEQTAPSASAISIGV